MHPRFETNLITNEIIGPLPEAKILRIAWYEKQQHIRQYLGDHYARFKELPIGYCDLGKTESLGLSIGVVDFDTIRERIDAELQRKERRNLWMLHRLSPVHLYHAVCDSMASAFSRFFESYLSIRYYWRGQWFTRAWWFYHHK